MNRKLIASALSASLTLGLLAGCGANDAKTTAFEGEAQGNNGPVKVSVAFEGETIKSIEIVEQAETDGLATPALENVPKAIVEQQSLDVDGVSGATMTSNAIKDAVEQAIIAAGLDVSKFKAASEVVEGETETADVVVVGAGLAGIMAAVELKTNYPQYNMIVLEKQGSTGGSLPFTGGAILSTDSKEHQELGLTCTTDDVVNYLKESSRTDELNEDLIKGIFALSGESVDMLVDAGFPSKEGLTASTPHNEVLYTDWAEGSGAGFNEFLNEYIAGFDFDLRLNTEATGLVVENGAVTGVTVAGPDSTYQINAKAVLLATGGFGKNAELMEQYAPAQGRGLMTVNAGATGDGILFTQQFGTPVIGNGTMGTLKTEDNQNPIPSTFLVGTDGRRFLDETMAGYRVQRAFVDAGKEEGFFIAAANDANTEALEAAVASGAAKKFDTLEALAADMGIDAAGLTEEASSVEALANGPYYVSRVICRSFGTLPGIVVDNNCQVVDGDGNVVPGLYAAGEVMVANAFTYQYPGAGFGISFAVNSGRYAAQALASTLG